MIRQIKKPRVVVLGGGNGTSRLLTALKPLLTSGDLATLHALVLNADDGGSTGRLRKQYDVSAMGDLTKCLVALSNFQGDIRGEQLLKALDYRFDHGDFSGHTLRNMFLTALEITAGGDSSSTERQVEGIDAGIAMMARILQIPKDAGVIPVTLKPLTQRVVLSTGNLEEILGEGQHFISHNVNLQENPQWQPGAVRVKFVEGDAPLNPRAAEVLRQATFIIIAPGHTFGTILPTLALPALTRELAANSAKMCVVMTLLTTPRQTTGWTGEDFITVYESYIGRKIDIVLSNTDTVPIKLVTGQEWVHFNSEKKHNYQLKLADVLSTAQPTKIRGDTVPRAIVVHDVKKIRTVLRELIVN